MCLHGDSWLLAWVPVQVVRESHMSVQRVVDTSSRISPPNTTVVLAAVKSTNKDHYTPRH
jgi:hypothetical protein